MRIEWTADALADFEHISTWIENERTLALLSNSRATKAGGNLLFQQ